MENKATISNCNVSNTSLSVHSEPILQPLPWKSCFKKQKTSIEEFSPLKSEQSFSTQFKPSRIRGGKPIDLFNGPKQEFTEKKLPKVSRLTGVMQKLELKKTKEMCEIINAVQFTSSDIQCQVENISAHIFRENRIRIEGAMIEPDGERTDFFKQIYYGLKIPKFPKIEGVTEAYEKKFKPKEINKSVLGVVKVHKKSLLAEMIPKLSHFELYPNFDISMMRLHQMKNQSEIKMPKAKAEELVLLYHPKMARQTKKVLRSEAQQDRRDKNTNATRVTRARIKYNEEQVMIESASIENDNIENRRRNACLIAYLNLLLETLGEKPKNFIKILENMEAIEFMEGQNS